MSLQVVPQQHQRQQHLHQNNQPQRQLNNHGYFTLMFAPSQNMQEIIWRQETAILGRSNTKSSEKHNFLSIGKFKTISREHGQISWNKDKECWDLKVLGKRGISSNGHKIEKDKIISMSMNQPTPIKMGESKFYFCPAAPPYLNTKSRY